jgi:hypothetical protein
MAEDKPEKRKPGMAKRIANWIGGGLLVLLFVAAVYFRAPWKVVVLWLAFVVNSTVVPKRISRWIWYSAAVLVIGLIVWVFLPGDNEGWRPFTLDEELAALEAKRAIPAEENAATIYNKLLKKYDPDVGLLWPESLDWELEELTVSQPWSSKDHPELATWLKSQRDTIETLIEASRKDRCRFPIAGDLEQLKANPPRDFDEVTAFWWSRACSSSRQWWRYYWA